VLGKKIELIYEDDQFQGRGTGHRGQETHFRDRVIAVLGEVASSRSMEAAPICSAEQDPMISPSSTNVKLTENGRLHLPRLLHGRVPGKTAGNFAENARSKPRRSRS